MPKQKKTFPSPDDKKCGKRLQKWLADGTMVDDANHDGTLQENNPLWGKQIVVGPKQNDAHENNVESNVKLSIVIRFLYK
jgi:hypothetical protein